MKIPFLPWQIPYSLQIWKVLTVYKQQYYVSHNICYALLRKAKLIYNPINNEKVIANSVGLLLTCLKQTNDVKFDARFKPSTLAKWTPVCSCFVLFICCCVVDTPEQYILNTPRIFCFAWTKNLGASAQFNTISACREH